MPRPVCVRCRREMTLVKSVTVQFDAMSVQGPYQQWQGDLAECPACGTQVIARYGERASWEHFQSRPREQPYVVVPEARGAVVRPMGAATPV